MAQHTHRWLLVTVVVVGALILIAGTFLIAWFFFGPYFGVGAESPFGTFSGGFASNGEQIYFTGTSSTGPFITASLPGMHRMPSGMTACVNCHGPNGEGGTVTMFMSTFEAPNIQYSHLTAPAQAGEHEDHPPYTDATIKRAITDGVDPAGQPLEWMMPRWNMTDAQLNDLLAFLKTLG